MPPGSDAFLEADDSRTYAIRGCLRLEDDWIGRWETLSHGERKRAQIATLLWHDPPGLAIDEPTNRLDPPSILCLEDALEETDCGLLLVSHDRRFLGKLSDHRWDIRSFEGGGVVELLSI